MKLNPTVVYDTYWHFAAKRQALYERRLIDLEGPWTDDQILQRYRFTNVFRAADRVSQYLIREVQYREDRSQAPDELFFRTLLFKIFNKIETWEAIEDRLGRISWQSFDVDAVDALLDAAMASGTKIYSAAYIMPAPRLGRVRKHSNHLALLLRMMCDGLPGCITGAGSLEAVYRALLAYDGLGPFLAYQYAIDLNYSQMIDFDENDFVVAGPGALDGIAKCFEDGAKLPAREVIEHMVAVQKAEFSDRDLPFDGLFGRSMTLIDAQNVFCEISKYARVAHPEIVGANNRTRIKQSYRPAGKSPEPPFFPPSWGLSVPAMQRPRLRSGVQGWLFQ